MLPQTPPADALDGYDIDNQVGFLLRRASQRHTALFQQAMDGIDLTPTQFNALVRIAERGAVTQNQLGRLTAMDPATIQGVVRRLVARALVLRAADPADRRAITLSPSPAGLALVATAVARGRAITESTLAPLSPAERTLLLALLHKVT